MGKRSNRSKTMVLMPYKFLAIVLILFACTPPPGGDCRRPNTPNCNWGTSRATPVPEVKPEVKVEVQPEVKPETEEVAQPIPPAEAIEKPVKPRNATR